jgi:hypothetical protein
VKALLVAAAVALAACGGSSRAASTGQVQPLPSPDGSAVLTVPIQQGSGERPVWTVTLLDPSGDTVYVDRESDFAGSLNVYWAWDESGLLWLYNSDDGEVWFYEKRGPSWTKNYWGAGMLRGISRDLVPPAGVFPDYVAFDPYDIQQSITFDSVIVEEGPGHRLMICYVPMVVEIPEIGDSLGAWAEWSADGFRDMVGSEDAILPDPGMPDYEFEIVFSQEPSPDGLICLLAHGYEYSGGAHGISWNRSFVFDLHRGEFVEPLSLVGDSAATADFCMALADTLRSRPGSMAALRPTPRTTTPCCRCPTRPGRSAASGCSSTRTGWRRMPTAPWK